MADEQLVIHLRCAGSPRDRRAAINDIADRLRPELDKLLSSTYSLNVQLNPISSSEVVVGLVITATTFPELEWFREQLQHIVGNCSQSWIISIAEVR